MKHDASEEAIQLLMELIRLPSFSRQEDQTARLLKNFLEESGANPSQEGNNIWAFHPHYIPGRQTLLLNSHHDTVKPNDGYTRDPFLPERKDGKIFGLGSNDAGASLVCLAIVFLTLLERKELPFNLAFAASAEEEISGTAGLEMILPHFNDPTFAIVGEPTLLQMATAEKGLMVLDCKAHGVPGHAAREEGVNAIYEALPDIEWFRSFKFPKTSQALGDMKMTVTVIHAGAQHNVVPSTCDFTVDVRVTDAYSLEETLEIISTHTRCTVIPRSMRIRPSSIATDHPLVRAAEKLKISCYGSPTTSDQAILPFPSVKIGPGNSARSHSADEFVYEKEIEQGIHIYMRIISELMQMYIHNK